MVSADVPTVAVPAGLSLAQLKMTGDEFVVLQNNTGAAIADLSSYWLYGFNNVDPLSDGVSSSSEQLPAGTLYAGETLLLSSNGRATCGASIAGKLSISLSDSSGFVQLAHLALQNGAVAQTVSDSVSWSSADKGIIQKVPSNTKDPAAVWYRYANGDAYAWQQAELDSTQACQYTVAAAGSAAPQPVSVLAPSTSMPPVVIESAAADLTDVAPTVPAGDAGLQSPLLNELLPNPATPQTDGNDEFIELYNPNAQPFDLSGFKLQAASTGSASAKAYTFPDGTMLDAQSFTAFTSAQTHLGLSNSGGQVWLIDPTGGVIGQTSPYGTAKDGQAWAFVQGSWQWMAKPTPDAQNIISAPAAKAKKSSASASKVSKKTAGSAAKLTSAVKGAATATPNVQDAAQKTNIHMQILVAVAALAVLYAAYEYKTDLYNRIHQFRGHRAARRPSGRPSTGR